MFFFVERLSYCICVVCFYVNDFDMWCNMFDVYINVGDQVVFIYVVEDGIKFLQVCL